MSKKREPMGEADFLAYDAANPWIWQKFVEFTLDKIVEGFTRYGAGQILGDVRWYTRHPKAKGQQFKIDQRAAARYARKFHESFPEHDGFFELRVLRTPNLEPAV